MTGLAWVMRSSDIARCPRHSLSARHYHLDGRCACPEDEVSDEDRDRERHLAQHIITGER